MEKAKRTPEVPGEVQKQMYYLRETPRVYREVRDVQDLFPVTRPSEGSCPGLSNRAGRRSMSAMTDPISDMLTRIRNAIMVRHESADMPYSTMKFSIAKLLKEEGLSA